MKSKELLHKMKGLGFRSPAIVEDELEQQGFRKFKVHEDLSVSVFESVSYDYTDYQQLPFNFVFVEGRFTIRGNKQLASFVGFPPITQSGVHIIDNKKLTTFHSIHKHIKRIDGIFDCGNATHILGLCLIKGIEVVGHFNDQVAEIMNEYRHDMLTCQQALIDAGFPQHAKL